MFSFFLGVALARFYARKPPKLSVPSIAILLILIAEFAAPLGGRLAKAHELIAIAFVVPAMIYWGAAATERNPKIGKTLGDASYGLHAIHLPLIQVAMLGLVTIKLSPNWMLAVIVTIATTALAIGLDVIYDVPVRRWLSDRLTGESVRAHATS